MASRQNPERKAKQGQTFEEVQQQGFAGESPDKTPREEYTLAGVLDRQHHNDEEEEVSDDSTTGA